jgi:uncharacterized membrane protein YphA (DoxX/SURF4 family)
MVIAHVKWFIQGAEDVTAFSFAETSVVIWFILVIALVSLAGLLNKHIKEPNKKFMKWSNKNRSRVIYVFQLMLAASLIFAAVNQFMFVPNYEAHSLLVPILEILTAIFLIINRWVWMGAVLLIVSYCASLVSYGLIEVLDYVNILGMGAFLYLEKPLNSVWNKWKDKSLDVLRISTGLALIILAFSEKLLAPGNALALLSDYDLNFMTLLGIDYSDRLFILSAGSMELVFGIIMVLGFIPRINTLALAVFLVSSNLYFFLQGNFSAGWMELMGHLPVIGTALLLVIYGKSFKKN